MGTLSRLSLARTLPSLRGSATSTPAPWNPWRVWWLRRLHIRRVQQAQAGTLRGCAYPDHDRRCQHPLGGGQGSAEEARPLNQNFTIHCDSLGLFYVLDFQPKLLQSIWAPI